jgi:hypothetical protein
MVEDTRSSVDERHENGAGPSRFHREANRPDGSSFKKIRVGAHGLSVAASLGSGDGGYLGSWARASI